MAWKDHEEARKQLMHSLTRADGKPRWSQGPRLADQIGDLFGNVDSQFAAPTPAQMRLLEELKTECETKLVELQSYFAEILPELNQLLQGAGVPAIAKPTTTAPIGTSRKGQADGSRGDADSR